MLLNQRRPGRNWVGLRLVEAGRDEGQGFVDVYGARARLAGGGGWRRVHTDGSYVAARDPRLLFPLPAADEPAEEGAVHVVEVHWPAGTSEEMEVQVGRYTGLRRNDDARDGPP